MACLSSSSATGHADAVDSSASDLVQIVFTHDATDFVAVTASGFDVFSCNPLKRIFSSCGSDSEMTSGEALALLDLAAVNHVVITAGEGLAALCTQGGMKLVETGPNPQGLCAMARRDGRDQETLVISSTHCRGRRRARCRSNRVAAA
jgi:hypothetical protein